jgi:hypothetical protein
MANPGMLSVSVTTRQRVALGTGSEVGFFTGSHPFVPGSVLRGALAAAWIAEHGPPGQGSSAEALAQVGQHQQGLPSRVEVAPG